TWPTDGGASSVSTYSKCAAVASASGRERRRNSRLRVVCAFIECLRGVASGNVRMVTYQRYTGGVRTVPDHSVQPERRRLPKQERRAQLLDGARSLIRE